MGSIIRCICGMLWLLLPEHAGFSVKGLPLIQLKNQNLERFVSQFNVILYLSLSLLSAIKKNIWRKKLLKINIMLYGTKTSRDVGKCALFEQQGVNPLTLCESLSSAIYE
jgi:hypothetical protein